MKAPIWRGLMSIGMYFHHFPRPHPPSPNFTVKIPSRLSKSIGRFKLIFYLPDNYNSDENPEYLYPVVVNFHGGGFTLGKGTDDARWARAVVETTGAVFVSVEYRLAPKHPFSTGVEDCADAVIYLAAHADELRIDPHRIALSGFSAGANFALTVPILLQDLRENKGIRTLQAEDSGSSGPSSASQSPAPDRIRKGKRSPNHPFALNRGRAIYKPDAGASGSDPDLPLKGLTATALEVDQSLPDFEIRSIIAFYPPVDFRISRADKKLTNPKPEYNLPPLLTNLFDESYLDSETTTCPLDLSDPYLSPAAATTESLRAAYPKSMILYTCEYDMLNSEGVAFGERLKDEVGIEVKGGLIKGVPHAFDKKPNPVRFPKDADRCYGEACTELAEAWGRRMSFAEKHQMDESYVIFLDFHASSPELTCCRVNVERFEDQAHIDRIEHGEADDVRQEKKKKLIEDNKNDHATSRLPSTEARLDSVS